MDEKFTRRDLSDTELPLNFWQSGIEAVDVMLQIDKSCLSDVEEWLGIENVNLINGKHIASAKLPYDNGLISKIMSFGSGVKVLSPSKLKTAVKNNAEQIIANYLTNNWFKHTKDNYA